MSAQAHKCKILYMYCGKPICHQQPEPHITPTTDTGIHTSSAVKLFSRRSDYIRFWLRYKSYS